MSESEWTKILGWPGYRVYRSEIDEAAKTLRLWVRRKRGNRRLECSGCGQRIGKVAEVYEREVRDLRWSEYRTTVVIELYRVRCPECGIKAEKVPQLPSKAPFSKRFEEAVGLACESAAVRRVARQFGLSSSTVRAIDLRYLRRWAKGRRKPALRQMGVDEIYLGKKQKFLTVVSNLETGEPLWLGREREKATLDEFLEKQLSAFQRSVIRAACVDMHEPYRLSLEQWVPQCRLIYDKFHVMKHANEAVAEVRRAEFFRKGGASRELIKGKHWLLLTRWVHLNPHKKRQLNELFALNRRVMKAYLLKESLDRLWNYTYGEAGAAVAEPSRRNPELLQNQGTDGRSGSRQWKHQSAIAPWSGLPRSRLSAAEGAALGCHQDPIRRFPESCVECTLLQIVVQSPNITVETGAVGDKVDGLS